MVDPLRANRSIVAENCRNARVDVRHMFAHRGKRITDQRAAIISLHNGQAYFSFGEVHYLQRARIFDQAVDIIDD